jgi:hypothetical protein
MNLRFDSPERKSPDESGVREKAPTDAQVFGFADSEHRIAERYTPAYLAQGKEHLVYVIPGRPDLVLKANKIVMHRVLSQDPHASETKDPKQSAVLREAERELEHDRAMYAKLRKHFGAEHVPPQKQFLIKVPVTPALVKGVVRELKKVSRKVKAEMPEVKEAWTQVAIQKKLHLPAETFCPRSGNIEVEMMKTEALDERSIYDYERVTDELLDGAIHPDLKPREILEYAGAGELSLLALRMREEPGLRTAVKDFLTHVVSFAEETGEILDLFGEDNVVFYRENGNWTYKLIDPLYPFHNRVLARGREAYRSGSRFYEISSEDAKALQQAVRFTRLINALASLVNAEELKKPEPEREYAATLPFLPKGEFKGALSERFFPPSLGYAA